MVTKKTSVNIKEDDKALLDDIASRRSMTLTDTLSLAIALLEKEDKEAGETSEAALSPVSFTTETRTDASLAAEIKGYLLGEFSEKMKETIDASVSEARISIKRLLYRLIYETCRIWRYDVEDPDCNITLDAWDIQRLRCPERYKEEDYLPRYDFLHGRKYEFCEEELDTLFPQKGSGGQEA